MYFESGIGKEIYARRLKNIIYKLVKKKELDETEQRIVNKIIGE